MNLSAFDIMHIRICSPYTSPRRQQFAGYLPHYVFGTFNQQIDNCRKISVDEIIP